MKINAINNPVLDSALEGLSQKTINLDEAIQKTENTAQEIIYRQQYETKELLKVGLLGVAVVAAYTAAQALFKLVYPQ